MNTAPTEAEFQEAVMDLLRATGWKAMHVRRSIGKGRKWTTATSVVGWPDIFAWHEFRRRRLAIELKTDKGRLSDQQDAVLASLAAAGQEVRVWRPADWDEIVADLRGDHDTYPTLDDLHAEGRPDPSVQDQS